MTEELFLPGERALLVDHRGRRFLITLEPGATLHLHSGSVPHDEVLGSPEGIEVRSNKGAAFRVFRPRLADYVLKMSRGAQVVYPKDLGAIVVFADVFPGAEVLEAGTGSGALTMALCRAVGPEGRVVSYELRPDFHGVAAANVEGFFGKVPAWLDLRDGDVREAAGQPERFDRAVLDLPEPWAVLPEVTAALRPGGVLAGYLPTTPQVQSLAEGMRKAGYAERATFEVLLRTWHVTDRSVRPDHRMVGHTGFLVVGRKTVAGSPPNS
jgi:tRNA (adenine57-N1/adenine58-N1)-methyltransferase catalytic subunit